MCGSDLLGVYDRVFRYGIVYYGVISLDISGLYRELFSDIDLYFISYY